MVELEGIEPSADLLVTATVASPWIAPSKETKANVLLGRSGCWPFVFIKFLNHNTRVMQNTTGKDNTGVILFTKWPIYSFVTHRGENIIREWLKEEKVPRTQVAIFQAKIDAYERGGPDLSPGLIEGPVAKNIFKMKIKGHKGHVQLRPMVCYGPFTQTEVTMLVGAIEKGFKLRPENCKSQAQENRDIVIADRRRRRRERID